MYADSSRPKCPEYNRIAKLKAEVTLFPDKIGQYQNLSSASGLVWVTAKVTSHLSSITIEAHQAGLCRLTKFDRLITGG